MSYIATLLDIVSHISLFGIIIIIATTSNSSIGLAFNVDVDFTFFLIESEIGEVHKEYAGNYKNVILSRAEEVNAYYICSCDYEYSLLFVVRHIMNLNLIQLFLSF